MFRIQNKFLRSFLIWNKLYLFVSVGSHRLFVTETEFGPDTLASLTPMGQFGHWFQEVCDHRPHIKEPYAVALATVDSYVLATTTHSKVPRITWCRQYLAGPNIDHANLAFCDVTLCALSRHDTNFVVTGGTISCHDNLRYRHWQKCGHHGNSLFPVWK